MSDMDDSTGNRIAGPPNAMWFVYDEPYATVDGVTLKLDLYLPTVERPPLVMWIHGGGWQTGDKAAPPLLWLTRHGFAVASVSYRLTDVATFPAQFHDVKAALGWLRAHAETYGYDGERIAAAGGSAGGHLAALLGVTAHQVDHHGDEGEPTDPPIGLAAVVDYFGPTDFDLFKLPNDEIARRNSPVYKLFGGEPADHPDLVAQASPARHVTPGAPDTPGAPPIFIIHGGGDVVVSPRQAELLHERYEAAGVESTLRIIPDAPHSGPMFFQNDSLNTEVLDFLNRHLR
jgi:acetyl esterase/lipase